MYFDGNARSGNVGRRRALFTTFPEPIMSDPTQADPQSHPKGLYVLFATEMWERFSFYLMIGILPLYLTDSAKGGMGWSDADMAVVTGSYVGLVYFTPFLGGLVADRLLGCRKTILIGATLMMMGHLVLAWPTVGGLLMGLLLLIVGNGAFKPNISTLLGNLYPPNSPLKDTGYNIFYMGINIGAFVCNFIAALVRNHFDEHPLQITSTWKLTGWHAAFSTASLGMFIGLVTFAFNYGKFANADQNPKDAAASGESLKPIFAECLIPAAILACIGWFCSSHFHQYMPSGLHPPSTAFLCACIPVVFFYLRIWKNVADKTDRGRVAALLTIYAIAIVFWINYGLNNTTLTIWTRDNTNRETNALVEIITDHMPEFAENAPPNYYYNASATVPRPSKESLEIVTPEVYQDLEKRQLLSVNTGQKIKLTAQMADKVYKNADKNTPVLPKGNYLKLVNTELFQSINPSFIILLTPLVVALWTFLRERGLEPTTAKKMGGGLLIAGVSPLLMLMANVLSHDGATKASAGWLFATYAAVGLGELFLSSMGLSLVSKIAPASLRASMMGGWFLSTALGLKFSGMFGELYARVTTETGHQAFWLGLIATNVLSAILIFALVPWLNRQIAGEGDTSGH
jgi:POT family proton-dependent oligopeptide transporter